MTQCPDCQQTLSRTPESREIQLEYCPSCQKVWLDFGSRRPYERLEAQISQWEAGLAQRQTKVG